MIVNAVKQVWGVELDETKLEKVYKEIYKKLILEVDAIDNGVSEADEMRYHIKSGLASRVGRLNPNWNAPKTVS